METEADDEDARRTTSKMQAVGMLTTVENGGVGRLKLVALGY